MRKPILTTTLLLLCAGILSSQVTFGPKIGMTFSKYNYKWEDSESEPETKYKVGPALGGVVNIQFNDYFALQPSLMFTKKGNTWDLEESWGGFLGIEKVEGYMRAKTGYIELPVHAVACIKLGPGDLQIFAGPYMAIAVVGKVKSDITITASDGSVESEKYTGYIKFKNKVTMADWDEYWDDEDFFTFQKLIDFGLNVGAGYYIAPILINLGYSLGLTNLQPKEEGEDIDEYKYTNSVIFLNVAWLFECKKK
jgi:hypothetical protein